MILMCADVFGRSWGWCDSGPKGVLSQGLTITSQYLAPIPSRIVDDL